MRVWEDWDDQQAASPGAPQTRVDQVSFSPNGGWIVSRSEDKSWEISGEETGQQARPFGEHQNWVNFSEFNPDGTWIVAGSDDESQRVSDAESGQHGQIVHSAQFSPDGRQIVTASLDKTARVWDAGNGKPLTNPLKHEGDVRFAEFSCDGKRILTASYDKTARVWDALSGNPLTNSLRHSESVTAARFSPDGKRVVTGSFDHTARVWNVQSGQPVTDPLKHFGEVECVQFSPDGKQIVTSDDAMVRVWDISANDGEPPEWLSRVAEFVGGEQLNKEGTFEPVKEDRSKMLKNIREQVSNAPADDAWTIFGRWFLADRCTRTISPYSKITIPEYIDNRIREGTDKSFEEALRLSVGNVQILERIEKARTPIGGSGPVEAPGR